MEKLNYDRITTTIEREWLAECSKLPWRTEVEDLLRRVRVVRSPEN